MPTYACFCTVCSREFEYVSSIAERHILPKHCGVRTERRINAPMVAPMFEPYKAVAGDRRYIRTKAEHRDFLREFNYVEVGNDPSMAPPNLTDEEFEYQKGQQLEELTRDAAELKKIEKELSL
jgi:hypothetical protein